jgi:uncharacterized protein YggU (UPF0235/DUF167 family)
MYIKALVTPGARKERVTVKSPDTFLISVREPAERNLANHRIRQILAEYYSVPVAQVRLLTGHRSSSKMLVIDN